MAQSKCANDVFKVFKFAAEHSDFEWVVHRNGETYTLGSIHNEISSASYQDYGITKRDASIHSHPNTETSWIEERISMGYLQGRAKGDRKKTYLGLSPKYNYVYFPNSKRLYNIEVQSPRFIKSIRSYNDYYFGTLNIK